MKAKKEMAERHLINESHVYVGEGALHITHACVHTPVCVQALLMRAKQLVCWQKPGRSGGEMGLVCGKYVLLFRQK